MTALRGRQYTGYFRPVPAGCLWSGRAAGTMTRGMRAFVSAVVVASLLAAQPKPAHAERWIGPEADFRRVSDWALFATGAAAMFIGHELNHVITDAMFGKDISFQPTSLGPFPFYAIEPCCNLTRQQAYVIGSAGYMSQYVASEVIL